MKKNLFAAITGIVFGLFTVALQAQAPVDPVPADPTAVHITSVHPNPATERIMIEFNSTVPGGELLLRIRDARGHTLLQRNLITVAGGNAVILPVQTFPTGEYTVQLDEGRRLRSISWQKM